MFIRNYLVNLASLNFVEWYGEYFFLIEIKWIFIVFQPHNLNNIQFNSKRAFSSTGFKLNSFLQDLMEFHWHDIWWSFSECLPKVAGSSSLERVVAGAGIHWKGSFRFNSTQWPRLVFTWMPEIPSLPTDLLQEFQLNDMDTPCLLFSGKIICNYNRRDALEGKEERTTFKVGQHQENANKQQSRRMRNVTFPLSATDEHRTVWRTRISSLISTTPSPYSYSYTSSVSPLPPLPPPRRPSSP